MSIPEHYKRFGQRIVREPDGTLLLETYVGIEVLDAIGRDRGYPVTLDEVLADMNAAIRKVKDK